MEKLQDQNFKKLKLFQSQFQCTFSPIQAQYMAIKRNYTKNKILPLKLKEYNNKKSCICLLVEDIMEKPTIICV